MKLIGYSCSFRPISFQRHLVLVHKLMCVNMQFITPRFLKHSSLGPLLYVRRYHLISIAPTRLGSAPLLVISGPPLLQRPPPLAPSGRLYVLTAVLLCSFGFTRTHTQARTHPSRPSRAPWGAGDTRGAVGGCRVCACHCLLSVITRVATRQLFAF